jgi:hypothetical protein
MKGSDAEIAVAFADTHRMLYERISIVTNLPIGDLDKLRCSASSTRSGAAQPLQRKRPDPDR